MVTFTVHQEMDLFLVYSDAGILVPEVKLKELTEFIARANWGVRIGYFGPYPGLFSLVKSSVNVVASKSAETLRIGGVSGRGGERR